MRASQGQGCHVDRERVRAWGSTPARPTSFPKNTIINQVVLTLNHRIRERSPNLPLTLTPFIDFKTCEKTFLLVQK